MPRVRRERDTGRFNVQIQFIMQRFATLKTMSPANPPPDFVPIFEFVNNRSTPITLYLELTPQEVELLPGDAVQVLVYKEDETLPIHLELGDDYLCIHPNRSWGNWYVYKNGEDFSGTPYRTPYTKPFVFT
ncbi:hypothetical protein IV454_21575 [Massilia antarctica]|uniref:Uncharacterized protein n=1 Tax=Massilia antarctica TaxID=2765360 RepID=A0AA49A677_9BURK|nr:hypothetical protein [Massilia antarctica]QPI48123.1 hypothetical protein IV454_21575 [Massilia antarctica]